MQLPHTDGFFSSDPDPYFQIYDGNHMDANANATDENENPNHFRRTLYTSSVQKNTANCSWPYASIKASALSSILKPGREIIQYGVRISFLDKDKDNEAEAPAVQKQMRILIEGWTRRLAVISAVIVARVAVVVERRASRAGPRSLRWN